MKPSDFLEPCKIRLGSIHSVNLERTFTRMLDNRVYEAEYMLTKGKRFCLVVSITKSNIENALVIPIKSKSDSNIYPYEFYMDICLKEGWDTVLCISQMTLVPIESINTQEIATVNRATMEKIYMLIDEFMGRKNPVHLSDTNCLSNFMKKIEPVDPTIFAGKKPELIAIERNANNPINTVTNKVNDNISNNNNQHGGGRQNCTVTPSNKKSKSIQEKSMNILEKNLVSNYITSNYVKSSRTDRKYVSVIEKELYDISKAHYDIKDIKKVLEELGYKVEIGRTKKLYISGMKKVAPGDKKPEKPFDPNFFKKISEEDKRKMKLDMLSMPESGFANKYGFTEEEMKIVNSNLTVHGKYGEISH